jgi:hypothetical protein
MQKTKTKSATAETNGHHRLPKASDYKMPKRLTSQQKRLIETSEVIFEGFRKAREKQKKAEG